MSGRKGVTPTNEKERFAALVREHARSMFRAARVLLRSDAEAEDAVGEAVLKAWEAFDTLKNPDAARGWLITIAVNCAKAQRRRQGRVVYLEDMEQEPEAPSAEPPIDLWEAVLRLPEEQRLVILLYYYEDMPVEETARMLDIPQGTVKSRLSRGRDRLRHLLKEDFYET